MAHEYVERYLALLPPELRPDGLTDKILAPLREAWRNKWEPEDLAKAVLSGNYSNSASPAGLAIHRLTQISKQPAPRKPTQPAKYQPPAEPVSSQSPDHVRQRQELIQRIIRERISSDEAGALMQDLLERQRNE